ncbi:MAG: site-2 protease family protein [Salinibacterium sp.]|nr:MAG: site-2 protease family protein [Salinibacterium sp.]
MQRTDRRISPIFIGLLILAAASGWALWIGFGSIGFDAFLFVLAVWVISLCLHEFGHAAVAYRYGDHSVEERGYLTLDPLRYTHPFLSIVLPLIFVLLGGIGLPGGAVFINRAALRSRFAHTAVAAAGPLMNIVVALLLAVALLFRDDSHTDFWSVVTFLLFLQISGAVLNLLPVPGLDGFGIIEPYLSRGALIAASKIAPFGLLILFVLLWNTPVGRAFFTLVFWLMQLVSAPIELMTAGYDLFRFWMP